MTARVVADTTVWSNSPTPGSRGWCRAEADALLTEMIRAGYRSPVASLTELS